MERITQAQGQTPYSVLLLQQVAAKVETLRAQVAVLAVLVAAVLVELELPQALERAAKVVTVVLAAQAGQHKTLRAAVAVLARWEVAGLIVPVRGI